VRAIVPTPGNGESSIEKSKSDARERFTRRFGLRLRGTGRNASRSGNVLSKDVDEFMFEIENQQSGVGGRRLFLFLSARQMQRRPANFRHACYKWMALLNRFCEFLGTPPSGSL
jgi:hypothetical protein